MKPAPILLVEDDENDIFFFQRAAKKAEVEGIQVVRDGQEAIDYLSGTGKFADRQQHPWPALVVLDLNLPRKHGLDVLRWRQENLGATPIVVILTSSSAEEDKRRANELGARSYFIKPNDPDDLVETLKLIKSYCVAPV